MGAVIDLLTVLFGTGGALAAGAAVTTGGWRRPLKRSQRPAQAIRLTVGSRVLEVTPHPGKEVEVERLVRELVDDIAE